MPSSVSEDWRYLKLHESFLPKAFDVDCLSIFGHKEHVVGGDVTVWRHFSLDGLTLDQLQAGRRLEQPGIRFRHQRATYNQRHSTHPSNVSRGRLAWNTGRHQSFIASEYANKKKTK